MSPVAHAAGRLRLSLAGYASLCIWLVADFFATNLADIRWIGPAAVAVPSGIAVTLGLAGVCCALLVRRLGGAEMAARVTTVATVLLFGLFAHEEARVLLMGSVVPGGVLPSVAYGAALTGALGAAWRWSRFPFPRFVIALTPVMMLALAVAQVVRTTPAEAGVPLPQVPRAEVALPLSGENVYFIVVDQYGGEEELREHAAIDIGGFLERMRGRGFTSIEGAHSNYTTTHTSLMATLEMDYIVTGTSPRYRDRRAFFPAAFQSERTAAAVAQLKGAGYRVVHIGNSWSPCRQTRWIDCQNQGDLYASYRRIAAVFLAPTKVPQWTRAFIRDEDDSLRPLWETVRAAERVAVPTFFVVHNLPPHPPHLRADCRAYWRYPPVEQGYGASVTCVNRQLESMAARILAVDPTAILVIQGDHGSGLNASFEDRLSAWDDAAVESRTSILNLVRAPAACTPWLRPGLSPINTMRFVLACLARTPPQYLDDRTFLTTYEYSPDYGLAIEVTERLGPHLPSGRPARRSRGGMD